MRRLVRGLCYLGVRLGSHSCAVPYEMRYCSYVSEHIDNNCKLTKSFRILFCEVHADLKWRTLQMGHLCLDCVKPIVVLIG